MRYMLVNKLTGAKTVVNSSFVWPESDGLERCHNARPGVERGDYVVCAVEIVVVGNGNIVENFADVWDRKHTVTRTITYREPSLDAQKAQLVAQVNLERDRRSYPGFVATGLGWNVDLRNSTDRSNIEGKVMLALAIKASGNGETIAFMGADNQVHALTPDQMILVGRAVDAWISSVYAASWQIKAAISAAEDPAIIDQESFWPASE